jgi:hypothetical protein
MNMRELIDKVSFGKNVLTIFQKNLAESHNVKLSAIRTANVFGIDLNEMVSIIKESKEKIMDDYDADIDPTMSSTPPNMDAETHDELRDPSALTGLHGPGGPTEQGA